jgi:opacity protein-like surface antigen
MRKLLPLLLLLTLAAPAALAQDGDDDDWRRARYRDTPSPDAFELTPFAGYRWGGTIFATQSFVFDQDVEVESSPSFGVGLGIPLGDSGLKLELLANRQSSELVVDRGIFEPEGEVADIDVTYLHAGVQIPFARSRNAVPYVVVSGGIANLDPQLSGIRAENRFSASAGVGIKLPMSEFLSLRLEGRGYYTALEEETDCTVCDYFYDENFYQGEVTLGLTFSF